MLAGQIETMQVPANPLDILAQQTVAAAALEPLDADRWFDTVRRSAPFATLPRSVYEATLDLLSGKYPSTEFAELRPRLVYDRDTGTLTARPGAQRLAVTSGGAIPDRGLFTVYLATRVRKALAGRRTRRGNGLRVTPRRRHLAGRHQLADHRDHPRPGAGDSRAGPAGPAAVLARRRRRPPGRAGRRAGRVHRRAGRPGPRRIRQTLCGFGFRRLRDRQPVGAARRAAHRRRGGTHRHHLAGRAVPRRAGRLAGDPALAVRAAGARPAGAGGGPAAARTLRHRREADRLRRRHRGAVARHRSDERRRRRAPSCSSSTPTRSTRSSPPKWAVRRCSRRGSGSARPAPCYCPAATPAAARRCGTSASAPPSCWTWPANTPTSRWCWRPSANACRTSTTSRPWSS